MKVSLGRSRTRTHAPMTSSTSRFEFALVLAAAAIALSGCAAVDSAERSITGDSGETYYTVATAPLHAKASASSKVVGHLGWHEKVSRIRIDHGYSFVVVGSGGLEGWVASTKLARRIPEPGAAATPTPGEPSKPKPAVVDPY